MEKENLFELVNHNSWKSMTYDDMHIYLSTKKHENAFDLIEACHSKKGLLNLQITKVILLSSIVEMRFTEGYSKLKIKRIGKNLALEFYKPKLIEKFCDKIATQTQLVKEVKEAGIWSKVAPILGGATVALAIPILMLIQADELKETGNIEVSGRNKWLQILISKITELIGMDGAITLTAFITIIITYFLYKKATVGKLEYHYS